MATEPTGSYTKEELEKELGGPIEVIYLAEDRCLLVNENARKLSLEKNKPASELYWKKNPESGLGADFVLGPAIHCKLSEIAHLDLLAATLKLVLTQEQKMANLLARKTYTPEEALACSIDNPENCEACGS